MHSDITGLRLARALVLLPYALLLLRIGDGLYLVLVAIVFEEAVELVGNHPLDEVLLAEPVQFAVDLRHELVDLLLIDLDLLQIVYHLEQLLLANLPGRRHLALLELLAYRLLYGAYLTALLQIHNRDRSSRLPCAPGSSAAMGIAFRIVRKPVVYNMRKVVHVKSACRHVGSHQQLEIPDSELLHHQVALRLGKVSVERIRIVSLLHQFVGDLLRFSLGAAEDDAVYLRIVVHNPLESLVLVLGMNHIDDMPDVRGALVAPADGNLPGVVQIILRNPRDLVAHRGREQERVPLLRDFRENGVDILREAHVQHLVSLVHHDIGHSGKRDGPALHQVKQPPGGRDDYMDSFFQRTYLALDGRAAVHRQHLQSVHILRIVIQIPCNLQAQLSRRTEYQRLGTIVLHIRLLNQRQSERRGLARSRLRQRHHVMAVFQKVGYDLFLHRHRVRVPHLFDRTAYLLRHAEFFKCLHL